MYAKPAGKWSACSLKGPAPSIAFAKPHPSNSKRFFVEFGSDPDFQSFQTLRIRTGFGLSQWKKNSAFLLRHQQKDIRHFCCEKLIFCSFKNLFGKWLGLDCFKNSGLGLDRKM